MIIYILRRLLVSMPLLVGITLLSFLVMYFAPGKPTDIYTQFDSKTSHESIQKLKKLYGLDKPLHIQYLKWLARIIRLDFGTSFAPDRRKVSEKILERIPITLSLNILSMLVILAATIPMGVISAVRQDSLFDRINTFIVFVGFSIPSFWLALLLMILFGVSLGWLPISGITSLDFHKLSFLEQVWDLGKHIILPVFVSAFGGLAGLSRYMRSSMLEVIRQDYIVSARARGLPEKAVIWKHALRNALLPIITILGLSVPGLIGGSVIFETIFGIPGMGQLFYMSVMARDYTVIMGILVIGSILTLAGNLIADVCYVIADPRIDIESLS